MKNDILSNFFKIAVYFAKGIFATFFLLSLFFYPLSSFSEVNKIAGEVDTANGGVSGFMDRWITLTYLLIKKTDLLTFAGILSLIYAADRLSRKGELYRISLLLFVYSFATVSFAGFVGSIQHLEVSGMGFMRGLAIFSVFILSVFSYLLALPIVMREITDSLLDVVIESMSRK